MSERLLDIRELCVGFRTDEGEFRAVDNVSFHVDAGEVVGLVGESGCGKSVTALSIPRLVPSPPGRVEGGEIIFQGRNLLALNPSDMRGLRGHNISMVFQEPGAALSPLQRIGDQLVEGIRLHRPMAKAQAWDMAREWLEKVRISDAAERMYAYPHQLSGGMQQRIMIAMAVMLEPALLIADEPTTALDVTIQAQVFNLIRDMRQDRTAILLITHDMGVVWEMCDRVLVMYAARIVESGPKEAIFASPAHPYTQGLLESIPRLTRRTQRLSSIPGQVPSPMQYPPGCRFHDRCPHAFDPCRQAPPVLKEFGAGHSAACYWAEGGV